MEIVSVKYPDCTVKLPVKDITATRMSLNKRTGQWVVALRVLGAWCDIYEGTQVEAHEQMTWWDIRLGYTEEIDVEPIRA